MKARLMRSYLPFLTVLACVLVLCGVEITRGEVSHPEPCNIECNEWEDWPEEEEEEETESSPTHEKSTETCAVLGHRRYHHRRKHHTGNKKRK